MVRLLATTVRGLPDLLLTCPKRGVRWVEVKARGGRLSPIQVYRHEELRGLGFEVETVTDA